jgi:hypothetical protein
MYTSIQLKSGASRLGGAARMLAAVSLLAFAASCSVSDTLEQAATLSVEPAKQHKKASSGVIKTASLGGVKKYKLNTRQTRVYHGRGPYICTPSGFGQTSRCATRASYRR